MPGAGGKKSAPKAHKLAEKFPKGLVLRDLYKKDWILGDVVGQGGFGMIYLASQSDSKNKGDHVIKIEPKNNGPLFCEMTFYQRIGRRDLIAAFISQHKLQYLPVPPFISTGMHEYKSTEYRFLAMPRYGTDLQKRLVEAGGTFPAKLVFAIGLRIIDALQYLHENEYVHADVKAANILQGCQHPNQVYLVDYGLAYRYTVEGTHKVYKEDPRKAHDGTIEFTSRDAHKGVFPSRRADLEILSYNLLQWLCGQLPWENKLSDPVHVASCKEKFFHSVSKSVSNCFACSANPNSVYSDIIIKFLDVVKALGYEDTPDYNKLRNLLKDGLKREGQKNEWNIDFAKGCLGRTTETSTSLVQNKDGSSRFMQGIEEEIHAVVNFKRELSAFSKYLLGIEEETSMTGWIMTASTKPRTLFSCLWQGLDLGFSAEILNKNSDHQLLNANSEDRQDEMSNNAISGVVVVPSIEKIAPPHSKISIHCEKGQTHKQNNSQLTALNNKMKDNFISAEPSFSLNSWFKSKQMEFLTTPGESTWSGVKRSRIEQPVDWSTPVAGSSQAESYPQYREQRRENIRKRKRESLVHESPISQTRGPLNSKRRKTDQNLGYGSTVESYLGKIFGINNNTLRESKKKSGQFSKQNKNWLGIHKNKLSSVNFIYD